MFETVIHGEGKADKFFMRLEQKTISKATRAGLTKAARPIVKRAKQLVPVESGMLKKAISSKVKTYGNKLVAIIGVKTSAGGEYKGKKRVPRYYAHLVEYGHRIAVGGRLKHLTRKTKPEDIKGKHSGDVKAKPFLRPAFDAEKGNTFTTIQQTVAAAIVAERDASA